MLIIRLRQQLKTIASNDRMTDELRKWKYLGQATVISLRYCWFLRIMTDIGSCFAGRSPALRSLCPTTEAFHSKNPIGRSAVVPYEGQNFLLCSVWSEICVNSALCFLYSEHQTNGDQYREADTSLTGPTCFLCILRPERGDHRPRYQGHSFLSEYTIILYRKFPRMA